MSIGFIIQARMGSTRFPAKILFPITKDKNMLAFLLYRLKQSKYQLPLILATTNTTTDDVLVPFAAQQQISLFRGAENDVLSRFIEAAEANGIDTIIRICSDNPLIDIHLLDNLIALAQTYPNYDYYSYYFNGTPVILTHFGIFCEIVSLKALKKVANNYGAEYKEHVTNGVYRNEQDFRIYKEDLSALLAPYEGIRLSIDTENDLTNVSGLVDGAPLDTLNSLFPLIIQQQELVDKMKKIIEEQKK